MSINFNIFKKALKGSLNKWNNKEDIGLYLHTQTLPFYPYGKKINTDLFWPFFQLKKFPYSNQNQNYPACKPEYKKYESSPLDPFGQEFFITPCCKNTSRDMCSLADCFSILFCLFACCIWFTIVKKNIKPFLCYFFVSFDQLVKKKTKREVKSIHS